MGARPIEGRPNVAAWLPGEPGSPNVAGSGSPKVGREAAPGRRQR